MQSLRDQKYYSMARDLHQTLDKEKLINLAIDNVLRITKAQYSLIILYDLEKQTYIAHALRKFELKEDSTIEAVAKECFVLTTGEPFECPDMASIFKKGSIYQKYFGCNPRSVLAEPIFDSGGHVIGVINVAHDNPSYFDLIIRNRFSQISGFISIAVANSISYRNPG